VTQNKPQTSDCYILSTTLNSALKFVKLLYSILRIFFQFMTVFEKTCAWPQN